MQKKNFNRSPTFATSHLTFESVYGVNPYLLMDLISLPKEELVHKYVEAKPKSIMKLHQQIHDRIKAVNEVYKKKSNKYKRP